MNNRNRLEKSQQTPSNYWPFTYFGCLGSVLVTLGSFGAGDGPREYAWLEPLGLAWLSYGHGKELSTIILWSGVALMTIVWAFLGRELTDRTPAKQKNLTPEPSPRWVYTTLAAWSVPLIFSAPIFSRDVYAYLAQGALFRDGFNPYSDGPVNNPNAYLDSMAPVWSTTTAPYGPLFVLLCAGITAIVGNQVIVGIFVMKLCLLPGIILATWALRAASRHFQTQFARAAWLVLLNPPLLIHLIGGPHSELLMYGFLAMGLTLFLMRRPLLGITALTLAATLKITAAVALPFALWLALTHHRRAYCIQPTDLSMNNLPVRDQINLGAKLVVIASGIFGAATLISPLGFGWLHGLSWADRIINWLTIPTFLTHLATWVASPWVTWGLEPGLTWARSIGAVLFFLIAAWLWWTSRKSQINALIGLTFTMVALLLLEPSTLPWYYALALIPAAYWVQSRQTLAIIAGLSIFVFSLFTPDDAIVMYSPTKVAVRILVALIIIRIVGSDKFWVNRQTQKFSTQKLPNLKS